jgi:hypothetical protein
MPQWSAASTDSYLLFIGRAFGLIQFYVERLLTSAQAYLFRIGCAF